MGPVLPKPVTTKVLERQSHGNFHVGSACMNGWREAMEDAHSIVVDGSVGFFGVFDGHCGSLCSTYVADRFTQEMTKRFKDARPPDQPPIDDSDMRHLSLEIDQAFLDEDIEGGSTGTYCVVERNGSRYHLQVSNVGDSRVMLGSRAERKCVSLTSDHKPQDPQERARIEAAGGRVTSNRVDGSLAVSRAFGDASYKGTDPYHSKVIAVPAIQHHDAEVGDFVLLCCDGVFEAGAFSNEDVVEFIFEKLDKKMDLASVAAAVVDEAMERGSKDNISAMIVQLGGTPDFPDTASLPAKEVLAGPYAVQQNQKFCKAYASMAEHAGMTAGKCCELRFDQVRKGLSKRQSETKCEGLACDFTTLDMRELGKLATARGIDVPSAAATAHDEFAGFMKSFAEGNGHLDMRPLDVSALEEELVQMDVPPDIADAAPSDARSEWFENCFWSESGKRGGGGGGEDEAAKLQELQEKSGLPVSILLSILRAQGGRGGQGDNGPKET